ncbi:MAG: hypothetical protein HC902_06710 [Calothrix sp. SM1_5_4]|nr:hypothetical protein [Calothrix sp. SM1_5_4]
MKRSTTLVAIITLVASVLVFFQNCGEGFRSQGAYFEDSSSGGGSGSNGSGGGGSNGDPNTGPQWAKGDNFNYSSLPANYQSQMVQVQITETAYMTNTGPKAIAISADGLGFVRHGGMSNQTQAQINQAAQQACYAISGGKPCALLAVGNVFNVSRNDLNNSFTYSLPLSTTVNSNIPFVNANQASAIASSYNAAPSPKAMALSLDGSYFWIAHSTAEPLSSLDEAKRIVLERCELAAATIPCVIYAENASVTFNPLAINRTPVIDYARTEVATNIPGMRQTVFNTVIQNDYLRQVNGTSVFGSIYISADGRGSMSYNSSATTADNDAKSRCTQGASAEFPCFKYATNKTIASLTQSLVSVKTYGMNLHCKVVPRASCAAHLALGCPAGGSYYVAQAGSIALQTCN